MTFADIISIGVVQLHYTENATYEDRQNNLVFWAKLFNAETWEEFKALANGIPAIEEVGNLMLILNTTDQEREILEGQRRYREQMASQYTAGYTDCEEKLNPVISNLSTQISGLNRQNSDLNKKNSDLNKKNSDLNKKNSDLSQKNSDLNNLLQKYRDKYGDI